MKRILLCLFILLSVSQLRASDTLTVRQVYSFCVGDTFDYVEVYQDYDIPRFTTDYSRVVINTAYVSPGQDTFIYNGNWIITNLDSIAIYQIDTSRPLPPFQTTFFDTSSYWGWNSNHIDFPNNDGGTYTLVTDSLGVTDQGWSMLANNFQTNTYEQRLIYFSDGHRRFGTPYYVYLGINNITIKPTINLYPNPTTEQIHLSISDMSGANYQLILTDILGQEVYTSSVTQSESTHDISNLSPGMYTWRLMSDNSIIKTGKIVKQ